MIRAWRSTYLSRPRLAIAVIAALVAVASGWRLGGRPRQASAMGSPARSARALSPTIRSAPRLSDRSSAADGRERAHALEDLRRLGIASRAIALIRDHYVDPDKIAPPLMLEEALQAVARLVPEMLVDAPRQAHSQQPRSLRVRVADAELAVPLAPVTDLYRLDWSLLQAVRFVADQLPTDVPASQVEYVAVNGMLSTLDPYSHMLDPDAWRDMQTNTGGNFGGLGIVILASDGLLLVQSVIEGSPAQRAGLQAGDEIHQIDGEDTVNMTVDDAVDRLRGEVGTPARLAVKRQGWAKPQEVVVVRAVIHLQSVEWKVLDNGIAYAKVKAFQRGTADELAEAVQAMLRGGAQNGLVLDLRDNPGGLLDEAVRMGDLFIAKGPAVITVTGGQRQRDERLVSGQGPLTQMPLAVLINGHSASASEVVAGALKYSNRAIVLGEQSFGKGSVQVPYEIGEGALKLTVAKYLVPGDISIHGIGITPDVGLQFVSATREQVRLFGGPHYSRSLERTRARMAVHAPAKPLHNLRILLPEARAADKGSGLPVDGPAEAIEREPRERAATLLRRSGHARASVTLAGIQVDLADMARADDLELVQHLRRQGIDWRAGDRVSDPQLRVQIAGTAADAEIDAGDVLRLAVTLTNTGKKPLHRLHVLTQCDDPSLDDHEQLVGLLEPGANRTVNLRVRISMRHGDLQVPVTIVAAQDGAVLPQSDRVIVTIHGKEEPAFAFRYTLDDQSPAQAATQRADGVLQPGEQAELRVEVRNGGPGFARTVVATLRSLSGARLHLEEGRVRLGSIAAGNQAVARFAIRGGELGQVGSLGPQGDSVRAELTLTDEALATERVSIIDIPWAPKRGASIPGWAQRASEIWDVAPQIQLSGQGGANPALIAPISGTCQLKVGGAAHFDPALPGRRFVTASVGGVKQTYHPGGSGEDLTFAAGLRLDSGLNAVTIQAQAGLHRTAEKLLLVHCTPAPTAPQ